jgi:rhodanese-related sulfurtransferase
MRRGIVTGILVVLILILGYALYYNLSSPLAMYPGAAKAALAKGEFDHVVDVRTDAEWAMGHFPLAIHIPVKQLEQDIVTRIPDRTSKILFYCNTTTRARMAAETAQKLGYANVRYLVGTHMNIM